MYSLSPQTLKLIKSNITPKDDLDKILENPSHFLAAHCDFFNHPDLFKNLVFDIDTLEVFCTDQTIEALKNKNPIIPVKVLAGNETLYLTLDSIKKSFLEGCVIDYLN